MKSIKISSKVEESSWQELRKLARESHQNISDLLSEAIREYVVRRRVRPVVLARGLREEDRALEAVRHPPDPAVLGDERGRQQEESESDRERQEPAEGAVGHRRPPSNGAREEHTIFDTPTASRGDLGHAFDAPGVRPAPPRGFLDQAPPCGAAAIAISSRSVRVASASTANPGAPGSPLNTTA